MSPADFASFSNNAIAFASVVYVLAFLSHIAEWAFGRSLPASAVTSRDSSVTAPVAEPVTASVGEPVSASAGGPVTASAGADGLSATSSYRPGVDDEGLTTKADRLEKFGRIGVALTVVAALLHLAGLVARGLGSDPARVPWPRL